MNSERPEPTQEELDRGRRAFETLPQDHRFEREAAKLSTDTQRCVGLYLAAELAARGTGGGSASA
jgi:hypothetical protein